MARDKKTVGRRVPLGGRQVPQGQADEHDRDLAGVPLQSLNVESLLGLAIEILGTIALRRRKRIWNWQARQLEDDLFEVLAELNNRKRSDVGLGRAERAEASDGSTE